MAASDNRSRSSRPLGELTDRLRRQARKITAARQAILNVLRHGRRPMSSKEIWAALPEGDCDLATIYRSMHLLEELGMVQRYDLGDGVARFQWLDEGDDGHHHHLICRQCAQVIELDECFLEEAEEKLAKLSGFRELTHKLEFFGLCPRCQ